MENKLLKEGFYRLSRYIKESFLLTRSIACGLEVGSDSERGIIFTYGAGKIISFLIWKSTRAGQ